MRARATAFSQENVNHVEFYAKSVRYYDCGHFRPGARENDIFKSVRLFHALGDLFWRFIHFFACSIAVDDARFRSTTRLLCINTPSNASSCEGLLVASSSLAFYTKKAMETIKPASHPPIMTSRTTNEGRRRRTLRAMMTFAATLLCIAIPIRQGRRLDQKYEMFESLNDGKQSDVGTITCENTEQGPCCASWEQHNADTWWLEHPDWEVSYEDHSTFCFSKIQNEDKAAFFRKIHHVQWNNVNCSQVLQRQQISSGWAASFGRVADAIWAAVTHNQPVQMTKHWDGMQWLYSTNDTNSWAFCENQDMSCYLLPQSPCPPVFGAGDEIRRTGGKKGSIKWLWLKEYVGRMQQPVRRKIFEMLLDEFPPVKLPCTAMHVRRGDSGIPRRPWRRYAAISEYLEIGEVQPGDNIVLLTDDTTTIQEVEKYHPNYNWIYAKRPRNNGTDGGFDGHIPSNDPAYDFVVILAELKLASQCTKLVHGHSSFSDLVYDAMALVSGTNVSRFYLDTVVPKEVAQANFTGDINARGHLMLSEIQDAYTKR